MNFYKIENGKAIIGSGDVVPEGFTAYEEQPQDLVEALVNEVAEQQKANRIAELKKLLADSDYKVAPDYDKPNNEIITQRKAWREEVRGLTA